MSRSHGLQEFQGRRYSRLFRGIILCIALSWALPFRAFCAQPGNAQINLLSALRLYKELDYEGALAQIYLAKQMPRTKEQDLTLLLYEGIILADLNQLEDSAIPFRAALSLNPDVQLPISVSPKVAARFEALREQVNRETKPPAALTPTYSLPMDKPSLPIEVPVDSTNDSQQEYMRSYSLIPAIAGGGLMVAGGISWAASRSELRRLRTASPSLTNEEDVQRSVTRGSTWQIVGISLVGAGAAGLLTAAGLYSIGKPTQPEAFSLSTNGSTLFVYGRWP